MMKSTLLVATMLVAAAAGAMAARDLQGVCAPCPSNFYTWYPFGNKGICPLCYKQPTPQCGTKYNKALCCGGDTGVTCPTIACTTSSAYAVAGPTGCAIANSQLSALAVSSTTFNMKYVFKSAFSDLCDAMPITYSGADWYSVTLLIKSKASYLSNVISEAVAATFVNYNSYACTCGKCGTSCTSNNNIAKTTIKAQVAAVAQACASTWLDAVAESTDGGCIGSGANAYAVAHADALASSIEYIINTVYDSAYSKNGAAGTALSCDFTCSPKQIQFAVARAIACGFVNVYTKIRDDTYTKLAADGTSASTEQTSVAEAFSCSLSSALAGSAAGSGTWSSTSGTAPTYDWNVECPFTCPKDALGQCPSTLP